MKEGSIKNNTMPPGTSIVYHVSYLLKSKSHVTSGLKVEVLSDLPKVPGCITMPSDKPTVFDIRG